MQSERSDRDRYDIVIVGGGINGTGIARDAAGRGLKVLLIEQSDLASATSSASSKLIHGGLRYLEHYEFRLVREALREREILLSIAPHLVRPLRFQLPHAPHLRPAWMIRAGLFLYDSLAKRKTLPGSQCVNLDKSTPLKPTFTRAFEYSDCWVDDARLVITNAIGAREHGADIFPRTRCESAERVKDGWLVTLNREGEHKQVLSKTLINATGPWVSSFIKERLHDQPEYGIRMVQGSHIIVPAIHSSDKAYILQNSDKRIVFVIPWESQWSMIGTTDMEYTGNPASVTPQEEEVSYLLDVVNSHFTKQLTPEDIIHSFSGVRPLCNDESSDPAAITRDYTLTVSNRSEHFPLLNIYGGKLTTYRRLAESALNKLSPWFPNMGLPWTNKRPLPGGAIKSRQSLVKEFTTRLPWLSQNIAERYASSYGNLAYRFLSSCSRVEDMGEEFGNGLFAAEVDYLIRAEWAATPKDILWRRTKLGINFSEEDLQRLENYIQNHHAEP